ncbi:MAG TPA: DinB family protein [Ktedonobacteraceae bacterium]|nr:DinB family protein [Ktedonobacteraceae bacterium]
MTEHSFPLAPFYKGWDNYQQQLVHAVAPLSPEQLTLRVVPHLRSIGSNAAHIIGARAGWLYYVLKENDENLVPLHTRNDADQPDQSGAELVSGLETTWQVIQDALHRWTIADLDEVFHDTDENGEEATFTRQWVIWHLIEHDLHHGGEISFALGMHGLTAIDL